MHILVAASTDLFIGTEEEPRQVVRVVVANDGTEPSPPATVAVYGQGVVTPEPAELRTLEPRSQDTVEVGVVAPAAEPGTTVPAEVAVRTDEAVALAPVDVVVAEPGWRMFMVSHFHYDPVWWNTQAAYTEAWEKSPDDRGWERPFQQPAFALIRAHLDMARRDPDYTFVLAELDYLKPYWDVHPEDRAYLRELLASGRLELMGGTYNEANGNLTSAENTARNAVYGVGYQRDVLGGSPATAWQLDVFGHDPQFPGMMASAGLTSSSWARGPFHEWGPNWAKGELAELRWKYSTGGNPLMQFPSEFDWVSPSGAGVLTCYMANHYSAGWWMDASPTLQEAEAETYRLFLELKAVAATRNVLLPVGSDYSPPNRWVTEIQRDWNARYVWPKFVAGNPVEFFAAVRAELGDRGRRLTPQTRDMNPVYTGKDVSYIDTKQMQRDGENTLLAAEKFATVAALLGARYPAEAIDKAWRQLIYGAHHDGITGSESDQVYLDLLGGWREALELGKEVRDRALSYLGDRIDAAGDGVAVTVFNPMAWPRTDLTRVEIAFDEPGVTGAALRNADGAAVPYCVERVDAFDDGSWRKVVLAFVAADVPGIGYRTYRVLPGRPASDRQGWSGVDGAGPRIENERYLVEVDPARGGAISRIHDKRTGKELLRPGGLGNVLLSYDEYPDHPHFEEGPWHLTPTGRSVSSEAYPVEVTVEECPIGRRITVSGPFEGCTRTQEVLLWDGVERVELRTHVDDWSGQDTLFRVRFAADVEGGMAVSEVGNAVVGRGFGFPNVDVQEVPFTLDNPAYNWFGLGSTARVVVGEEGDDPPVAARALSVAEVVTPTGAGGNPTIRDLVTALVRKGVTSTLSEDRANRYGHIGLDSNLPDMRVALGGPDENRFTASVLEAVDPGYTEALRRQLDAGGVARLWVPAERPLAEAWKPNADLRGVRDLPVLVVAGADPERAAEAVERLVADLDDAVVRVDQPAALHGNTGRVEDYGVAVLNRGIPGFNVEATGDLHLSLMRSCSGWPSGIWIDPPRRTLPGGGSFQFQQWSHTFEYALVGHPGDWRAGDVVRQGHDYNNPLVARVVPATPGPLPTTAALAGLEPADVVLTALKPTGNPMARMAGTRMDPAEGITVRAYESKGSRAGATLRSLWSLRDGFTADLLEEGREPLEPLDGAVGFDVDGSGIATVGAVPEVAGSVSASVADAGGAPVELGPRAEPAQPVFADYWLHNKGAAPVGYQPVTVQIAPTAVAVQGPFAMPVVVASERVDEPVAGRVEIVVPAGWSADPPERLYRLAPGSHLAFEATVAPSPDATAGRYFVAARIVDDAGQVHEDVVTVDLGEVESGTSDGDRPGRVLAIDTATRKAAVVEPVNEPGLAGFGDELTVTMPADGIRLAGGTSGRLEVAVGNHTAGEVRGEAQLLSPYETWGFVTPWSQGFAVEAGGNTRVAFDVAVPAGTRPGAYWALVKVMYYGRIIYTEAVPVTVVEHADAAAGHGLRE